MVVLGKSVSTSMNARVVGSGDQTVILAHGYGADQSVWDKIAPCLALRCRIVLFDWCFSGACTDASIFDEVKYSSYDAFAGDLIALLDEMNLRSCVFVGHSMSGMIGCIASTQRPDLFKSLILIGASPRYINGEDYEGGFENSDIDHILSAIGADYQNWASNFGSQVVDANDPQSVGKLQNCLKKMRPEVALALAKTVFLSDERHVLERVLIPCTIIQTTSDMVAPTSVADYMCRQIKGKSTVEIIDVAGHFPQLTAHIKLLEVLDRVLGF